VRFYALWKVSAALNSLHWMAFPDGVQHESRICVMLSPHATPSTNQINNTVFVLCISGRTAVYTQYRIWTVLLSSIMAWQLRCCDVAASAGYPCQHS